MPSFKSHQLAPDENLNCSLSEWSKRVPIFTSARQKPYYWLPLSHWIPLHNWLNNNQSMGYCFRASKRYTVTQYGRVGNFRAAWIFFRYHFLHFISKSSLVQIYFWTSSPNTFLCHLNKNYKWLYNRWMKRTVRSGPTRKKAMGQDSDSATSRFFQWTKLHKSESIKRWRTEEIDSSSKESF